mgnify:CR=1 FL=1
MPFPYSYYVDSNQGLGNGNGGILKSAESVLVHSLQQIDVDMSEFDDNSSLIAHFGLSLKEARQNFEREYLLSQIKRFNGNIVKISEFTGMERTALYRKFKSLNISLNNK